MAAARGAAVVIEACEYDRMNAVNDVAPSAYNQDDPPGVLPASPLAPRPAATGFRWAA